MSERTIIALSGGVDSAVAAWRLSEAGHVLEALHMTNWEDEGDGYCTAADDWQAARAVADHLRIPLHRVSFAAEYRAQVFADFLKEHAAGRTPNPDVLCNREVKFGVCLAYAARLGGTRLATGHYARIVEADDGLRLARARDANKDQSYFLQQMPYSALSKTLFPLGDLTKTQVRDLARTAALPVHDRPDSTGICFIGERPFREFLARYLPPTPGPIETPDGEQLGTHQGLAFHTIGQRQGLGIGGRRGRDEAPWYVAAKDPARNTLVVVQGDQHPLLYAEVLHTEPMRWLGPAPPARFEGWLQVRHRQAPVPAAIEWTDSGARIVPKAPLRGVAPGQYAALYRDDLCLGGGVIHRADAAAQRYNRAVQREAP
jgi:tRNA-uridine 2-sulfurtransferase